MPSRHEVLSMFTLSITYYLGTFRIKNHGKRSGQTARHYHLTRACLSSFLMPLSQTAMPRKCPQ